MSVINTNVRRNEIASDHHIYIYEELLGTPKLALHGIMIRLAIYIGWI